MEPHENEAREVDGASVREATAAARWAFLESESTACGVVGAQMRLVFLNAPTRALVRAGWSGRRCWEVFAVGKRACAARCPAARALSRGSDDVLYCEETLHFGQGVSMPMGVAVIAFAAPGPEGERGVLLLAPKPQLRGGTAFRDSLIAQATRLRAAIDGRAS